MFNRANEKFIFTTNTFFICNVDCFENSDTLLFRVFTAITARNVVSAYLHGNSIFTMPADAKSDRTVSRYIVLETQLHV